MATRYRENRKNGNHIFIPSHHPKENVYLESQPRKKKKKKGKNTIQFHARMKFPQEYPEAKKKKTFFYIS